MSTSETLPLYNPTATDPDGTNMAPNTSKSEKKRKLFERLSSMGYYKKDR